MKVLGEGSRESKLWLIGEAPGSNEEHHGRPFCGGAGTVLDGILKTTGIKRGECYVDNIMQDRPKGNDFGQFYLDKGRKHASPSLLDGHERIKQLIRQHRPNVVVCLGNESLFAVIGHKEILNWRGSILNLDGVKVIPTIHPAMVMRQYEFRPISVMDFNRIKEESLTPNLPTPYEDRFVLNPTFEQVMYYLTDFLPKQKRLSFDIETGNRQIICNGFGWSEREAICIPMFFSSSSWWKSVEEEVAIIKASNKLFANPNIEFIAQNAQYDMTYLKDLWGTDVVNLYFDTMIGFHCLHPELKKSLGFLTSIYTRRPYHKGMIGKKGVAKGATPTDLWHYNCLDCVTTWECAHKIEAELAEFGTLPFYREHSHQLIKPLMEIQRRGIRINLEKRAQIGKNLEKDVEDLQTRLNTAVGHELNVASSKQMIDFLYGELKMPPQRNRLTKGLTADADAIEFLAKKFPNPAFTLILDIREIRRLLENYIRATVDGDERIRCSYKITGTVTGRLASAKNVYGGGTNLQNIPRGELIRSMFIADEGMTFINIDLSQAEARLVAYLSGDVQMQRLFEQGGDVHTRNASMIFGVKLEDVSPEQRQMAKALVHAANYVIGYKKFAKITGLTENRAQELLFQYYAQYPSIKTWHREVEDVLGKTRILTTPLGRKRMFFGRWGQDLIREAVAHVPQSTVGDLLNWGISRSWTAFPQDWSIVLQGHDSVLVQVPKVADRMHIYKFFKHYYEIPFEVNKKIITIPVDFKEGTDWGNMKKMEVPR